MAAPGDPIVAQAYIPSTCSSGLGTATEAGASQFASLTSSWSTYVQSLMPEMVPGIVLGSLSAAGGLFFLVWIGVWHRRRRIISRAQRGKKEHKAAAKAAKAAATQQEKEGTQQFMMATEGEGAKAAAPEAAAKLAGGAAGAVGDAAMPVKRRKLTAGRVLKWSVVLLGLATMGVAAWGLAESILATDSLVSDFWRLVDGVEALASELTASLAALGASLAEVAATLGDVNGALQGVLGSVDKIPVVGGLLGSALPLDKIQGLVGPKSDAAVATLNEAADLIQDEVVPLLNDTVLPAIQSVYESQDWTLQAEDKWRYIVVAVLFGLLILFAAAVAWACFFMTWGRTAIALVACLWILNAVVMLLGMGLLNGAKTVAQDACLYTEDLAFRLVNNTLSGDASVMADQALRYYFGYSNLTDSKGNALVPSPDGTTQCDAELTAALLREVAGIDIASGLVLAWNVADELPSISGLLGGVNLPKIPFVNFDLDSIKDPVVTATAQMQGLLDNVCNTTLLLVRENRAWPLYVSIKTYVCCDLASALHDVWVPWVTAGSLAFVLSFAASARCIQKTLRPTGRARFGGAAPQL